MLSPGVLCLGVLLCRNTSSRDVEPTGGFRLSSLRNNCNLNGNKINHMPVIVVFIVMIVAPESQTYLVFTFTESIVQSENPCFL